jgi:predicted alpha/beta-fold hydrolase
MAVGVSLGGNALLRWAQEAGQVGAAVVSAITAISAPIDLAAGGWALGRGLSRRIYTPMFLQTMKPKALLKLQQHPGLFDAKALADAHDLYAFDNVFTAPLHGFKSTEDYWARASAKPHLQAIRLPTLLINARNDPFVPAWSLPDEAQISPDVTLWQPEQGGHVGFPTRKGAGRTPYLPQHVGAWLQAHIA